MNQVILSGRLCADPELKQTPGGKSVVTVSVATKRNYDPQTTDFHTVVCFGNTAEFLSRFFQKGQRILLRAELQYRKYTDARGNRHTVTELLAQEIDFLCEKKEADLPVESPLCALSDPTEDDLPF